MRLKKSVMLLVASALAGCLATGFVVSYHCPGSHPSGVKFHGHDEMVRKAESIFVTPEAQCEWLLEGDSDISIACDLIFVEEAPKTVILLLPRNLNDVGGSHEN